ncbi:hypothetical protein [Parasediminibacterium sp. JCM 36343]|uniref:hypothetical protein n=1 Tax=Parasediminibacterium sp. JCM 36343 TaxID=3374279 RepID=UPI00397D24C9
MNQETSDSFLLLCKAIYLEGVSPSNAKRLNNEKCIKLVGIAKSYFANNEYEAFTGFFYESQYFIALWAAHLILEEGSPDKGLAARCIKLIENYTNNPLAPEVAKEETEWLAENREKYK